MNQVVKNVSDTAFLVAALRAREMERPDPLFRDPLAHKLAGEHGQAILATVPKRFPATWSVVIRTVIIDDYIADAVKNGVDTVVNLGAGLDTRPYRMNLPDSLQWIEVDFPHVIDLKAERLAGERPNCQLEHVKLDLTDRPARQKFFAEVNARGKAILVLTEGVTPYLVEDEVGRLADDLRAMDKLRYWIVDYFSPLVNKYYGAKGRARFMKAAPFVFQPKDWFGFFAAHGWKAEQVRYLSDEGERLKRPLPMRPLMKLWLRFVSMVASPERQRAMRSYAAYVLLIPK
ncbi:MAG: SAM-dependent methyltransferase [Hyphomicrobiales bacterium]